MGKNEICSECVHNVHLSKKKLAERRKRNKPIISITLICLLSFCFWVLRPPLFCCFTFFMSFTMFLSFFHFSPGSRTMSISCLRIGMLIGKMVWPVMNTENEPTLQGWSSSRWYLAYETFCSTYAWARMTLECALLSLLWVCEIH